LAGVVWCHCPNGGARRKSEAKILAGLGVKPGVPDVLVILAAYLLGLFATAEYLARRAHPPDGALGCAAVLWPVVLPIALIVHGATLFGRAWLWLRRVWGER